MTLEFHKLTAQIEQMGQALATQKEDLDSKTAIALQIMEAYADPAFLPHIQERVQDAVDKDAGYRGARPLDEPIMQSFPQPSCPNRPQLSPRTVHRYSRPHTAPPFTIFSISGR